ncbi:hypothetical protein ACOME3_005263 [Neoechinorhynchus agilis]
MFDMRRHVQLLSSYSIPPTMTEFKEDGRLLIQKKLDEISEENPFTIDLGPDKNLKCVRCSEKIGQKNVSVTLTFKNRKRFKVSFIYEERFVEFKQTVKYSNFSLGQGISLEENGFNVEADVAGLEAKSFSYLIEF